MDLNHLVDLSSRFVTKLFANKLSSQLSFHSAHHTGNVVIASQEIALHMSLSAEDMDLIAIAAWFHDTGYTETYTGHELASVKIAKEFLIENGLNAERIEKVLSCILATIFPQRPQSKLEMVLCDADFYHFSRMDYTFFERSLRSEWESCLNISYTDQQWNSLNFQMLTTHQYFTDFGKTVLQERKQINVLQLQHLLSTCNQSL